MVMNHIVRDSFIQDVLACAANEVLIPSKRLLQTTRIGSTYCKYEEIHRLF